MKKVLMTMMAFIGLSVSAQPIEQSKIFDNVSITIKGGVTTPLNDPVEHYRGVFGVELNKEITTVLGIGVEGETTVNTSSWYNISNGYWLDHQYVGAFTTVNWMNLLCGYNGKPRVFEIESVIGIGWGHFYDKYNTDGNVIATKAGLNFNYNFGDNRAWTISLKPAVLWNLNNTSIESNYNINRAALQLQAGITYHFNNHNNSRYFTLCNKVATQYEIDALNDQINTLREQNQNDRNQLNEQINNLIELNKTLSEQLRNIPKIVTNTEYIIPPIQFKQGSCELSETSISSIYLIYEVIMRNNLNYNIIGYASEEGDFTYNKELSVKRAETVKQELIKLGVPSNRLTIVGNGETNQFGNIPELNRIVIID